MESMAWDLDETEARELVEEYLAAKERPGDDVWVITGVIEHDWGWAVSCVNRRYQEGSRSPADTYSGGGQYLVDRTTGRVAMAGSAKPLEHFIEEWRAGRLPDIPRPT